MDDRTGQSNAAETGESAHGTARLGRYKRNRNALIVLAALAVLVAVGWNSSAGYEVRAAAEFLWGSKGRSANSIDMGQALKQRGEERRRLGIAGKPMDPYNGFDLSDLRIPKDEVLRGGVPKNGIPAILKPKFVKAEKMLNMRDDDEVLGVVHNGVARAYPLRIIVWHEIVNDTVGGMPIAATYCPLCGSSMVFDRRVDGVEHTFGVSGLLYNSDVLMYDHQTESLWSQLKTESVAGPKAGAALTWLPAPLMKWAAWKKKYPESEVLSADTGYRRNYRSDGYASYKKSDQIMFDVPITRKELPLKSWVVGVLVDGSAKAYSIEHLETNGVKPFRDVVGGRNIIVEYDADSGLAHAKDAESDEAIPVLKLYWFAWQAFYPATEVVS
jgi:hypothetical protein